MAHVCYLYKPFITIPLAMIFAVFCTILALDWRSSGIRQNLRADAAELEAAANEYDRALLDAFAYQWIKGSKAVPNDLDFDNGHRLAFKDLEKRIKTRFDSRWPGAFRDSYNKVDALNKETAALNREAETYRPIFFDFGSP